MTDKPDTIEEQMKELKQHLTFANNVIAAMTETHRELQRQIDILACENTRLRDDQCKCNGRCNE